MKKRAYISVFDKTGILELAERLTGNNWEIVSTGKTAALLEQNNIPVLQSSHITGFDELLGGKVKSLHPKIFAAILADEAERKQLDEKPFSLVVVDLYPFEKVMKGGASITDLVRNIDIGGVALLRAAAKNYANVAVVCDKADYMLDFDSLNIKSREKLALKAFMKTSCYDKMIASGLQSCFEGQSNGAEKSLRYGENPHQKAVIYDINAKEKLDYEILNGKELSYNNIVDMDSALVLLADLNAKYAAVIVKHNNPCGAAIDKQSLEKAWEKALFADSLSAFGGIVALSNRVNLSLANRLLETFLEVIIAIDYEPEALELLKNKKNLRIIKLNTELKKYPFIIEKDVKVTPFGILEQEKDTLILAFDCAEIMTGGEISDNLKKDLIFALKVAKSTKSNAIVVAKNEAILGICGGQTSRVGALKIAIERAKNVANDLSSAVLASDAFFPKSDNIEECAKAGIKFVVAPLGSIKDAEIIAAAKNLGITFVGIHSRHFKH